MSELTEYEIKLIKYYCDILGVSPKERVRYFVKINTCIANYPEQVPSDMNRVEFFLQCTDLD